jgi:molecular chaperone IbpA
MVGDLVGFHHDSYLLKEKIMNQLVRFDTNALNRALVGFDTLFNDFEHRLAGQIKDNYPPYNILKHNENSYELEIAVTGFTADEVTVEIDQNQLIVKGKRTASEDTLEPEYLHRGLSTRGFERTWTLAEHMEVGQGAIKNGILKIELKRVVPEALKPRQLKIKAE